ncbi:DnaD domain protein [Paenibacillus sinopodophylli]|uniref:DnaD domain protein n=1 Tax=Paenibacillus sinopodophylli TaxID=1837342 RepID=UPI0014861FD3|nr:DnaD domain protein [Paenibacillus sinopodophylli]
MNQVAEMNAFIDWLETNPLEPTTQTLWFHLMAIANKSGYPEWFTVANPLLQAKVGVTENTLSKHRNYLVQRGRIEYKSMGKQKAGKYRLISHFAANIEVKHEVKGEVKHEVKYAVKGDALLKDLSSTTSSSTSGEYESYYAAHIRVFGFECNPFQSGNLGKYIDEDGMDETVVIRAIERAGLSSTGYKFGLITKILNDYFNSKVKTLQQAVALDAAFENRKAGSVPQSKASTNDYAEIARELEHAEK